MLVSDFFESKKSRIQSYFLLFLNEKSCFLWKKLNCKWKTSCKIKYVSKNFVNLSKYPPHPAFNFEVMKWCWTNFQMQKWRINLKWILLNWLKWNLEFYVGNISPRSFILWRAMKSWPKPPFSWFVWVIAQAQAMACGSCQGMLYVHLYRQGLNYSDHNHKLELMLFMWIIKFYETYLWWCKFLGKYSDKRKFENKPSFWDSETLHTLQIWKPGK